MKTLKYIVLILSSGAMLFINGEALAICPICTVVVGAGIGLAQWLGIDDTITGIWIGGFIVSLIMWTIMWLRKKGIASIWLSLLIVSGYYLLLIVPLYYHHIIGHMLNKLWGVDKILLGIFIGSVAFCVMHGLYVYLKHNNGGKVYFPMQKVVMPVVMLLLLSGTFYYLTK